MALAAIALTPLIAKLLTFLGISFVLWRVEKVVEEAGETVEKAPELGQAVSNTAIALLVFAGIGAFVFLRAGR